MNWHVKSAWGIVFGYKFSYYFFSFFPEQRLRCPHCSLQHCRFLSLYPRPLHVGLGHVQVSLRRLCILMGSRLYSLLPAICLPFQGYALDPSVWKQVWLFRTSGVSTFILLFVLFTKILKDYLFIYSWETERERLRFFNFALIFLYIWYEKIIWGPAWSFISLERNCICVWKLPGGTTNPRQFKTIFSI